MMTTHQPKRMIAGALITAGLAMTGMAMSTGTATAGTPPTGPFTWCPGDPPVETGNKKYNPVIWDTNTCHSYFFVYHGQGNVAQNIWDGPNPPGPPEWTPGFTPAIPPAWCMGLFLPSPCPPK